VQAGELEIVDGSNVNRLSLKRRRFFVASTNDQEQEQTHQMNARDEVVRALDLAGNVISENIIENRKE